MTAGNQPAVIFLAVRKLRSVCSVSQVANRDPGLDAAKRVS